MVFSIVTIIAGVHENQRGHHKMMILNSLLFDSLLKSCVFLGVVGASHHSELLVERSPPSVTIPSEQREAQRAATGTESSEWLRGETVSM